MTTGILSAISAMNEKLETPGLVIREIPIKENNSLLTVLTATQGIVTATAYGARKPGASLSAGTKLFNYADFTFIESRGRYKVDAARSIESFFGLSRSVEALSAASYFAEVLYDICVTGQPDTQVLRLALNCLYALMTEKRPIPLVKAVFELRLLAESGFAPELDACAGCGCAETAFFCPEEACVFCANCARQSRFSVLPVPPGTMQAMRYLLQAPMPKIFAFTIAEASMQSLGALCERYVRVQTGRKYESLNVYHALMDPIGDGGKNESDAL